MKIGNIKNKSRRKMMVKHIDDLESIIFKAPIALEASMKVLVSKEEGWMDHVFRVVSVGVGGYTPKHEHPWPHINYFLEGNGELMIDGVIHEVKEGSYAFVNENTIHQFKNTGDQTLRFICIVPTIGHKI
jgi:quercetin dioxygenase-like cupin family protein